jgi:hypothetical protein
LLRPRVNRPRSRRTDKSSDELAPLYSHLFSQILISTFEGYR